jgi:hypothetical protein
MVVEADWNDLFVLEVGSEILAAEESVTNTSATAVRRT